MKLSYKWLSEYVDLSGISPEELARRMTTAGLEVEGVEAVASGTNLVIGEVLECWDHPDSDHLHVTKVRVGDNPEDVYQIVCGAPNVRASHFFSFAPFLLSLTFYANGRMAEDEKVTAQALITGAISLSGVFSYLFGGMLVTVCGPLRALLLCTLIGMAGGALFLLFVQKDQQQAKA